MCDENRNGKMVKIPPPLQVYFNYRCYPRISGDMELEWWCSVDTFNNINKRMGLGVDIEWCVNWFETNRDD